MNREEIIRMAREAGVRVARMLHAMDGNEEALTETEARDIAAIERFATLVAAAEREACARECGLTADYIRGQGEGAKDGRYEWMADGAMSCADAIRARSNT